MKIIMIIALGLALWQIRRIAYNTEVLIKWMDRISSKMDKK